MSVLNRKLMELCALVVDIHNRILVVGPGEQGGEEWGIYQSLHIESYRWPCTEQFNEWRRDWLKKEREQKERINWTSFHIDKLLRESGKPFWVQTISASEIRYVYCWCVIEIETSISVARFIRRVVTRQALHFYHPLVRFYWAMQCSLPKHLPFPFVIGLLRQDLVTSCIFRRAMYVLGISIKRVNETKIRWGGS